MMKRKSKKIKSIRNKSIAGIKIAGNSVEWGILLALVLFLPIGHFFGLLSFGYNYLRCEGKPVEINRGYYRIPGEEEYGLHLNSHYVCFGEIPADAKRDPNSKVAKAIAERKAQEEARIAAMSDYTVYIPEGFETSSYSRHENGNSFETTFTTTTGDGREYKVRIMRKDSDFSYTNLCSRPPEGSWSGTVIGQDNQGREICRTNLSKYIKDYIVGVNFDNTAIMLQTKNDAPEELLNSEVVEIYNAMKPSL